MPPNSSELGDLNLGYPDTGLQLDKIVKDDPFYSKLVDRIGMANVALILQDSSKYGFGIPKFNPESYESNAGLSRLTEDQLLPFIKLSKKGISPKFILKQLAITESFQLGSMSDWFDMDQDGILALGSDGNRLDYSYFVVSELKDFGDYGPSPRESYYYWTQLNEYYKLLMNLNAKDPADIMAFVNTPLDSDSYEGMEMASLNQNLSDIPNSIVNDYYYSISETPELNYSQLVKLEVIQINQALNIKKSFENKYPGNTEDDIKDIYSHPDFKKTIEDLDKSDAWKKLSESAIKDWAYYFFNHWKSTDIPQIMPNFLKHVIDESTYLISFDEDVADYFLENIKKYYDQPWAPKMLIVALKHYSVANKFVNSYYPYVDELHNADWSPEAYKIALLTIDKHDRGDEESGFSSVDSYKDDKNRFTGPQVRQATMIGRLMNQKVNFADLLNQGLVSYDQGVNLNLLSGDIDNWIKTFVSGRVSSSISEIDRESFQVFPKLDIHLTPLHEVVNNLLARYLVQTGELERLKDPKRYDQIRLEIIDLVGKGLNKYLQVLEVDVPLYDKLYAEFDDYRADGRLPMEVYLGRDGVYAYLGRKAMDAARRWGAREAGRRGEILAIHPKYLVYPRHFRDFLATNTKKEFLAQEKITQDSDPLFYDTGFTGTIPEQIMRIMGFSDEEIEKRIRLLSADKDHRRVRGIPPDSRSDVVASIEYNSKLEDSAEGLYKDPSSGKIKHVAKPTTPEEQFYFMMIKQAIIRHYWLKERLNQTQQIGETEKQKELVLA